MSRPHQPGRCTIDFAADCLHWQGYKPCQRQRSAGLPTCAGCTSYEPIGVLPATMAYEPGLLASAKRVGILEMGGLGSHLRTTAVTRALRRLNPAVEAYWLTHAQGAELLRYVPAVRPVDIGAEPVVGLLRSLDVLLNFESNPPAADLCALVRCVGGLTRTTQGRMVAASPHAYRLQRLRIDNGYRQALTGTMQEVLLQAVGLPGPAGYDLALPAALGDRGDACVRNAFRGDRPSTVIGLNLGSSRKGRLKRWPAASWVRLADLLRETVPGCGVLLLGGPAERDVHRAVVAGLRPDRRLGALTDLDVGGFLAVVRQLQAIVTADTFALQAAIALGTPAVVLVGPMPYRGLELTAADRRVGPALACAPCYYRCAHPVPGACMSAITPMQVLARVEDVLGLRS